MARPPKVPGKADNWQIRLFLRECVAVSTSFFGLEFNSKNSVYYGWTPKNASGGQKWQISSDRPNLDSYGKITGNGISENLKKCRFPFRGVAPVILTYVLFWSIFARI